jgi:hypothetical protein
VPIYVSPEWARTAYSVGGLVTPAATATDIFVIRGAATKVCRVTRVEVVVSATAAGVADVLIKKHTIANTVGTSTNPTPTLHDSNDPATPAATLLQYSANPTVDASATVIRASKLGISAASGMAVFIWSFGDRWVKPIALRGIAQELAINLNGDALLTGELVAYSVEWFEDNQ